MDKKVTNKINPTIPRLKKNKTKATVALPGEQFHPDYGLKVWYILDLKPCAGNIGDDFKVGVLDEMLHDDYLYRLSLFRFVETVNADAMMYPFPSWYTRKKRIEKIVAVFVTRMCPMLM